MQGEQGYQKGLYWMFSEKKSKITHHDLKHCDLQWDVFPAALLSRNGWSLERQVFKLKEKSNSKWHKT